MKGKLWLTGILAILSIAVLAVGWHTAYALRNRVEITKMTLSEGKSAVEGLEVTLHTQSDCRLHWDSVYPVGQEDGAKTSFYYTAEQSWPFYPNVYKGMCMDNITSQNRLPEEYSGVYQLLQDVAQRAPAGKTYMETVALADYYDTYPLTVSVGLPNCWYLRGSLIQSNTIQENNDWDKLIQSYFQIPVAAGHQIEVTLQKNAAGTVTKCEVCAVSEPGPRSESGIQSESVVSDDRCYFTMGPTMDGRLLDFSGTPGGYGVWCFDYNKERPQAGGTVIRNFYPVDLSQATIEKLGLTPDGKHLLIVTSESERLWLTVLDAASGELLQKCDLMDFGWQEHMFQIFCQDDVIVVMCFDGRFTLLTPSDTGYEVAFSSVYRSPNLSDSLVFAFGQGKLAVADADDDSESERYRLSVFDATGLLFTGMYRTGGGYYTAHSLLNSSSVSLTWRGADDGS